ncbi:MAG: hypothetical protein ACFFA7_16875 [Promethearchaeota archaeon]
MRKKLVTILVVFAFLSVAGVTVTFNVTGNVAQEYNGYDIEPTKDMKTADEYTLDGVEFTRPHSPWDYPTLDDYLGILVWREFDNIFNGTYGNIWISLDPAYDEYIDNGPAGYSPEDIWVFGYPWSATGYPDDSYPGGYYLPPGYKDTITGQDLLEVLNEFDTNIHDTDVGYFGEYADRAGPFGDYKVQIMVFNLRDEWFYDPVNAAGFTEGYFWSAIANWGANAFHMDTYQWWRRQGGDPPMVDPLTGYDYGYLSVKAWEYEGTFAHEFQHLIHYDRDPDEFSWVNEGCSTLAEWLCGYGFSPGHISEYLLWFWDTPLTIWEGYLADYGASFLWTFYMYQHYGGASFLWDLVQDQANGIAGYENTLAAHHIHRTFDQIFQDWCIANYLDDTSFGHGRYGYWELDIPSANSEDMSIQLSMELWATWYAGTGFFDWFVDEYPYEGSYILAGRGLPYTASYVKFTDMPQLFKITFDGDDYCGAAPTSGTHNWYSGGEAWSWYQLGQTFDVPATGATLQFSNYFSIELDWDYGYVEVHDLTTDEWTTLPGLMTTDYLGHEQNNPNTPNEREPTTYNDAGKWNCFTGESNGLYTEMMDLTPFAGHTIELYFTYWTDGYTLGSGWYLDDIEIPEIGFYDDCETEGAWTFNGWSLNDEIIYNNFEVSFITTYTLTKKNGAVWHIWDSISKMCLNSATEEGMKKILALNNKRTSTEVVMVVANQPGYEHTFGTSYTYTAGSWNWHCHWHK